MQDDAARTLTESYPLLCDHRILFNDMDALRHVNNGAIGRYFEEGRADFNMRVFGANCFTDPAPGFQILLVKIEIEYLLSVHYPGSITIRTGIARIGSSSFVVAQAAFQADRCCALAETAMVKAIDCRPAALATGERSCMEAFRCANAATIS